MKSHAAAFLAGLVAGITAAELARRDQDLEQPASKGWEIGTEPRPGPAITTTIKTTKQRSRPFWGDPSPMESAVKEMTDDELVHALNRHAVGEHVTLIHEWNPWLLKPGDPLPRWVQERLSIGADPKMTVDRQLEELYRRWASRPHTSPSPIGPLCDECPHPRHMHGALGCFDCSCEKR